MRQFGLKPGPDPKRKHADMPRQAGRPVVIGGGSTHQIRPREARNRKWANDPHCHWCGKLTKLPPPRVRGKKHVQEHDWATLDHLVSRFEAEKRRNAKPGEKRWVLACFECNNRRAREEDKRIPIEELRRRSGRDPDTGRRPDELLHEESANK